MKYTHIDNDSDEEWFHPICSYDWRQIQGSSGVVDKDYCVYLDEYARGEANVVPSTEWCPKCLNHPDLPMYELKHIVLEDT